MNAPCVLGGVDGQPVPLPELADGANRHRNRRMPEAGGLREDEDAWAFRRCGFSGQRDADRRHSRKSEREDGESGAHALRCSADQLLECGECARRGAIPRELGGPASCPVPEGRAVLLGGKQAVDGGANLTNVRRLDVDDCISADFGKARNATMSHRPRLRPSPPAAAGRILRTATDNRRRCRRCRGRRGPRRTLSPAPGRRRADPPPRVSAETPSPAGPTSTSWTRLDKPACASSMRRRFFRGSSVPVQRTNSSSSPWRLRTLVEHVRRDRPGELLVGCERHHRRLRLGSRVPRKEIAACCVRNAKQVSGAPHAEPDRRSLDQSGRPPGPNFRTKGHEVVDHDDARHAQEPGCQIAVRREEGRAAGRRGACSTDVPQRVARLDETPSEAVVQLLVPSGSRVELVDVVVVAVGEGAEELAHVSAPAGRLFGCGASVNPENRYCATTLR